MNGAREGEPQATGPELVARTRRLLTFAGGIGNVVGALIVFLFVGFVGGATIPDAEFAGAAALNSIVFVAYLAVTVPFGRWWAQSVQFRPIEAWLRAERPASTEEALIVLRYPRAFALNAALFWVAAAVLFSILNAQYGKAAAVGIGVTILLGAVSACSVIYLLVDRFMRPVVGRALGGGAPPRLATPGVAARMTMAWTVATGVPLVGIAALAIAHFAGADFGQGSLIAAILFLAGLAIVVGLLAMLIAAKSVAEPVGGVQRALERIERGDFEARVPVDDGSEVGLLQAGFNEMAGGLGERERLREAFGTFVDPGLTERVLAEGTDLAGEEVELTVMFCDVRGFTTFAEGASAREAVARLNELYELIVPIILSGGGHASKFIGDGLLAVFGAPEQLPDHGRRAVDCALRISSAVEERFGGELRIGIGVNSGRVIAGTIGGGGRLDFTVIGDPVNTAARVEAATRETGDDVLITEATLAQLDGRDGWEERPPVPLKGKSGAVALFAPGAGVSPSGARA